MQCKGQRLWTKKSQFGYYSKTALLSRVKNKKNSYPMSRKKAHIERILYMPINLMRLSL